MSCWEDWYIVLVEAEVNIYHWLDWQHLHFALLHLQQQMAVWKTLRTQPSSADSFRITRIYSTPCTTTQPWQSGWVWRRTELNDFQSTFIFEGLYSNKNRLGLWSMKYFQFWSHFCFLWRQQKNKTKRRHWSKTARLFWPERQFFIRPLEQKQLAVKQWLTGWSVFPVQDKERLFQKLEERPRRRQQRVPSLFYSSSFSRNLIFKHAIRSFYGLSAACKVMPPSLPAECQPLPTGTETGQCCCQKISPSLLWGRGGRGADQLCCHQTNQLTCMYASDEVLTRHTESFLFFN